MSATYRERSGYEYIRISDYKKEMIFEGFVDTYSEKSDSKDILLKDPLFYDLSGKLLYSGSYFHVHFEGPVAIEFPRRQKENEKSKKKSDFWKLANKGQIPEYESLERPPPPEPISIKSERNDVGGDYPGDNVPNKV